jgi:hypothetical protein
MTDMLDAVGQELAFLQLKSDEVFDEHLADAFKKVEERGEDRGPEQDVIDNDSAAEVGSTNRAARAAKRLPFSTENTHHASMESRSIARPKRHHRSAAFVIVGGEESQLLLVLLPNAELVIAGLVVQSNEKETTSRVAEVINGILAARNRVLERVLTVTSEPRAKETVMGEPEVSTQGAWQRMTAVRLPWSEASKLAGSRIAPPSLMGSKGLESSKETNSATRSGCSDLSQR